MNIDCVNLSLIFISFVSFILTFPFFIDDHAPRQLWKFSLGIFLFCVILLCNNSYQMSRREIHGLVLNVTTVENIDIVVYDNRIINLNERFKRDFPEGSNVFEIYPKTYFGFGLYSDEAFVR